VYSGRILWDGVVTRQEESECGVTECDREEVVYTRDCHAVMKTTELPRILRLSVPNKLIMCLYVLHTLP
jgi:hypothetical protein